MSINNPGNSDILGSLSDYGLSTQDINLVRSATVTGSNRIASLIVKSASTGKLIYGAASAAGNTHIGVAPPPNNMIRQAIIDITENATMAVAGENTLQLLLDGVIIYNTSVYIPEAASTSTGLLAHIPLDLSDCGFSSGASGTLNVVLGTALATGSVIVNGYFSV